MRNKLADLNDILFEQIERINDDELHGADLEDQLMKAKQIVSVSNAIVGNAKIILEAAKLSDDYDRATCVTVRKQLLGYKGEGDEE